MITRKIYLYLSFTLALIPTFSLFAQITIAETEIINAKQAYSAKNYTEALNRYKKAVELGNTSSLIDIGYMYEKGRGVSQSFIEAKKWYDKAATAKVKGAEHHIGFLYETGGTGLPQDYNAAMKQYKIAAERGETASMLRIGMLYEKGRGVTLSLDKALEWYQRAEKSGSEATTTMFIERVKKLMGK